MKRGGSLSFLVGTISNVLVMEIGWTDVGSGGHILVSCAHSNISFIFSQDSFCCLDHIAHVQFVDRNFITLWHTNVISNVEHQHF